MLLRKIKLMQLLILRRRKQRMLKYRKRFWIRKIYAEREEKGEYYLLVQEMKLYDQEYFFTLFRISPGTFEKLLSWTGPFLQKDTTNMRQPISPSERLCVTM